MDTLCTNKVASSMPKIRIYHNHKNHIFLKLILKCESYMESWIPPNIFRLAADVYTWAPAFEGGEILSVCSSAKEAIKGRGFYFFQRFFWTLFYTFLFQLFYLAMLIQSESFGLLSNIYTCISLINPTRQK